METDDQNIVNAILNNEPLPGQADPQNPEGQPGGGQPAGGGEEEIRPFKDEHGEYHFGKVFGKDYSDPTRIKPILEKAGKISEYEKELETLRASKTQFEQQISELSKKPTYKNPTLYKLDRVFEESPNDYPLIQTFALGQLNDVDLIKADIRTKYPDLAKDETNLQLMLENEYGVLFDPDADNESKEYKAAELKLRMRATDLRKNLQERLDKIEVPDPAKISEARTKEINEIVAKWKAPFGQIQKDFTKISITVPDEKSPDKMVELMSFDIPESERGEYLQLASQHIAASRLSPENGGAEQVSQMIKQMYILRNFPKIVAKVAEEASKSVNGKWRDIIHNTGKREAAPGASQGGSADISDQLFDKLKADGQI